MRKPRFMAILPTAQAKLEVAVIDERAQRVEWRGLLIDWILANRDGVDPGEIRSAVAAVSAVRCWRTGGGAAPAMMLAPVVRGKHLDKKWRADSPDHPACALCEQLIQGEDAQGDEIGAIRVLSVPPGKPDLEMAFHPACFACVSFP